MKIKYKNKRLTHYLVFTILWLVLGTLSIIYQPGGFLNYGYFLIGLVYLGIWIFTKSKQYLTIENGVITKNGLRSKSMVLNDIKQIKKFGGDYTLKTPTQEMKINTQIIEENSLTTLDEVLDNLNLVLKK